MSRIEKRTWISEEEAASIINLPGKFFRKLVLKGSLKGVINYINSRKYKYRYNRVDIDNYLFEDSFFMGLHTSAAF